MRRLEVVSTSSTSTPVGGWLVLLLGSIVEDSHLTHLMPPIHTAQLVREKKILWQICVVG